MNRYHVIAAALLVAFALLAVLISTTRANDDSFLAYEEKKYSSPQFEGDELILFNHFMTLITRYGREVVWGVSIVLIFVLGGSVGRKTALVASLAISAVVLVGELAKETVARPRPAIKDPDFLLATDANDSFPSGHAAVVSAGASTMLVLYRDSHKKLAISASLAFEAALVCFSRIYIGPHYPTDVLGGILLGIGLAFLFMGFARHIQIVLQFILRFLEPRQ